MGSKRGTTIVGLGAALAAVIALGACSGAASKDSASSSVAGGVADAKAPAQAEGLTQGGGTAQQDGTAKESPDLSVDQRSIIYRGDMTVRVKDVTAAAGQATGIATTAGGFIGSDDRSSGDGGDDTATMELRVPAEKFDNVIGQLSKLGTEQGRKISTEDVTEQTVDLDARIKVQQARVDTANQLLAKAKSLSDLVMLEKEVATRESDLAALLATKRHMADLVTLSTITVTLLSPAAVVPVAKKAHTGFVGGLAAGWHGFLASLRVVLTVLGAVLPFVLILGIPLALAYRLARRRGLLHGRRPVPVPATGPAPEKTD